MAKSCANVTEARLAAKTLTDLGFDEGRDLTTRQRWDAAMSNLVNVELDEVYPGEVYFEGMLKQVTTDFCVQIDIKAGNRRRADTMLHFKVLARPKSKTRNGVGKNLHYSYLTVKPGWVERLTKELANMQEVAELLQRTTPRCPVCQDLMLEKLLHKTGHPHDGEEFWGCWKYPDCHGMIAPWKDATEDPEVGRVMKDLKCPECGGIMVVRIARKGPNAGFKFYGCQRYPECKGTLGRGDAIAQMLMNNDTGEEGFRRVR